MYSWGCGHWGALGHGIFEDVYVPLAIDWEPWKEEKIVRIAAGPFHSAAITGVSLLVRERRCILFEERV